MNDRLQYAKDQVEILKNEAVTILGLAGMAHVNAKRVVECIISATMLEVVVLNSEAMKEASNEL